MQAMHTRRRVISGITAMFVAMTMSLAPLAGCSSDERRMPPPPVDDTRGGVPDSGYQGGYETTSQAPVEKQGMSGKKKLVILAGAAALYYLYKKHQNAQAQHGPESQYYLSKNGRVYYRDAEGRAHWVTPPAEGIRVPESEATAYREFQGYQNQPTGMDLMDLAASASGSGPGR